MRIWKNKPKSKNVLKLGLKPIINIKETNCHYKYYSWSLYRKMYDCILDLWKKLGKVPHQEFTVTFIVFKTNGGPLKKHPVYILPATSSKLVDPQLILKSMEFQGERFKFMNGEKTHSHKFWTLCFTILKLCVK